MRPSSEKKDELCLSKQRLLKWVNRGARRPVLKVVPVSFRNKATSLRTQSCIGRVYRFVTQPRYKLNSPLRIWCACGWAEWKMTRNVHHFQLWPKAKLDNWVLTIYQIAEPHEAHKTVLCMVNEKGSWTRHSKEDSLGDVSSSNATRTVSFSIFTTINFAPTCTGFRHYLIAPSA